MSFPLLMFFPLFLSAQEIATWAAPPYWSPPATSEKPQKGDSEAARIGIESLETVPTPPLPLIGINPCRIVDTRGNAFMGAYGPPALTQGSPRDFVLTGQCGIAGSAQAVSLNVTVTNTQGPGHIVIYPEGGVQPTVSTLNYVAGQTVANAAIVPLGTGGGITVVAGVSATDLIIDTNGYYAPETVVNTINGLSGAVTLAPGTDVSMTPAGNTLTIGTDATSGNTASTIVKRDSSGNFAAGTVVADTIAVAGARLYSNQGGSLELGGNDALAGTGTPFIDFHFNGLTQDFNTRLVNDADSRLSIVAANGAVDLRVFGDIGVRDNLRLSNTTGANNGVITKGGIRFLHNFGIDNTFLGVNAGNFTLVGGGSDNTATGSAALQSLTTGHDNTAIGVIALRLDASGDSNIAVGNGALQSVVAGSFNTAVGEGALANTTGSDNTAVGFFSLVNNTGSDNIAVGNQAGQNLTFGHDNIDIGAVGLAGESSTLRIGSVQSKTFIAGIRGVTTGAADAVAVMIDSNGQLGTASSSRRFKQEIEDLGDASQALMKLRPVTFQYKASLDPTGSKQYGLIAEEVAQVFPDLVVSDKEGKPETVKYHVLPLLLLNELQRQQRTIDDQRREIYELKARLERLEALSLRLSKPEESTK